MDKERKPVPLGRFDSEQQNKRRWVLGPDPDESNLDIEIVPAIRAIRQTGIETIASSAGLTTSPFKGWGSYIQLNLHFFPGSKRMANKISKFAEDVTTGLREELNNPNISLQLVSAEKWNDDLETMSMEVDRWGIYRLQLVGSANDDEIKFAWNKVAEKFNKAVVE
ncbi:hypothetical protein HYW59_02010 [Candidatus Kaiserbacteria bacterium]|nr:hypothetical protein [Candidatus Kaiserbacteria bacterium]